MGETRHLYINKDIISSMQELDKITPEGITFSGMIGETVKYYLSKNVNSLPQFEAGSYVWKEYLKKLEDEDFKNAKDIYIALGKIFEREIIQRNGR